MHCWRPIGVYIVAPDHPEADLAVLFTHNEGYSTMCGHATIAVARWAVDTGRTPRPVAWPIEEAVVRIQCPCGLVTARVTAAGAVHFESVPSFAVALDVPVTLDGGQQYALAMGPYLGTGRSQ